MKCGQVGVLGLVSLALHIASASRADAQLSSSSWTVSAEAGGLAGSTWLDGTNAPRVASKIGFLFGVSAMRGLSGGVAGGAALRVGIQPLELDENGATWSGGTLAEYDLVGGLAFRPRAMQSVNAAIELGGGAAVLTGANDVLPFSAAPRVAPLAEIGASVLLGGEKASRRQLSLLLRYGMLRMKLDDGATDVTAGWVTRVTAGIRVSR